MNGKIRVLYSCDKCGLTDRPVYVVEREPGESISQWMQTLGMALSRNHDSISPGCRTSTLAQVKIPVDENGPIGVQPAKKSGN